MATLAVGDIHGNLEALDDLLGRLRDEAGRGDSIVFLGDYIDRGPNSRGCIDAILAFQQTTTARVVCLRGNHEDWLLSTKGDHTSHSWLLGMEGLTTVRSYSSEAASILREALRSAGLDVYQGRCSLPYDAFFDTLPASHGQFFAALQLSCLTEECLCSHAGIDPALPLDLQTAKTLIWGSPAFPSEYRGDRCVVYGHFNDAILDRDGWPQPNIRMNTIGLDTSSHGVVTAVRLPDRRVFQSARYLK